MSRGALPPRDDAVYLRCALILSMPALAQGFVVIDAGSARDGRQLAVIASAAIQSPAAGRFRIAFAALAMTARKRRRTKMKTGMPSSEGMPAKTLILRRARA